MPHSSEGESDSQLTGLLRSRRWSPNTCYGPAFLVGEPEALAKKQRLVLDQAYRYLEDQSFGVLEPASPASEESAAMSRYRPRLGSASANAATGRLLNSKRSNALRTAGSSGPLDCGDPVGGRLLATVLRLLRRAKTSGPNRVNSRSLSPLRVGFAR